MESVSQIVATKKIKAENYRNTVGVTPTKREPIEWIKLKAKIDNLTNNYPEYFKKGRVSTMETGEEGERKMRYEVVVEHFVEDGISFLIKLIACEKMGIATKVWYLGIISSSNNCYRKMLVDTRQKKSAAF